MFYSHQLLARKVPLGQIWMAATVHAKINRRKLDQLDIIKICEEILNPSVPMALRLSGILMGGVVIVYERKVKLLYDDVSRFLVEINKARTIKYVADPTLLPKGKTQAKYEAVTLPDNVVDMEVEQPMHFSDASITTTRFQRMRLDDLDEHYININTKEDDLSQHYHQAEAVNITIFDDYMSGQAETDFYNRFEKFDIDGDEETQMNITPQEQAQAAPNVIPSPAQQNEHPQAPGPEVPFTPRQHDPLPDDVTMHPRMDGKEEQQRKEQSTKTQGDEADAPRRRPLKRKARRGLIRVDNDQIMIPGSVYHSWIQDASNIVSKRRRKNKVVSPSLSTRISSLMDLAPVALISGLEGFPAVNYPAPLMELWRDCTQTNLAHCSPSGGISPKAPEKSATHSPTEGFYGQQVPDMSEVGSHREDSIEMLRAHLKNMDFEVANEALPSGLVVTPGSPGKGSTSIPSSGLGHALGLMEREILPSGRSRRKQHSLSRASLGNLDPVEEEISLEQNGRGYKLKTLSEHGPTPDHELMEETGPTQTQHPAATDASIDKITQSIRMQLKSHFDTPGAPQVESLDQLAAEMSRKKAAQLFYQTCVLATNDLVKVQQSEAYGDILISRGSQM